MYEVSELAEFTDWFEDLKDTNAKSRILVRLRRFSLGNLGDVKSVGQGVWEARLDYGPGYRVYFVKRGETIIILLCGGTKSRQQRDIEKAQKLAEELEWPPKPDPLTP
jgi:putative addiction module killer protein